MVTPASYADFAELVVPELQRRGAYRKAYEPGTLRHKLFGRGDCLPDTHPGAAHRRAADGGAGRPAGAPGAGRLRAGS